MTAKVASKLARLRLSGDRRRLLKGIPITDLEESQEGNHVYWASGRLRTAEGPKAIVRIWIGGGGVNLTVCLKDGREVTVPYSTENDRTTAAESVTKVLDRMAD